MSGPFISVIMPVYNREAWVGRAIDSVLSQTYPRLELLVVDDGSTDGTRRVLESYGSRLTIFSATHAGAYRARNLALEHARGELIGFIDSDDVWYPDRLERQLPLFERPEVGLVFGDAVLVDYRHGEPRRMRWTFFDYAPPSRGRVARQFAYHNFVPLSSVLARRHCFERLGGFIPAALAADYAKWFQIALHYEIDYVPAPVFEYALHSEGISHDMLTSLPARIELFKQMLDQTQDAAAQRELRHILFNLELRLAIAYIRRSLRMVAGAPASSTVPLAEVPYAQRLAWGIKFLWNQLKLRLDRRVFR
jgi:glycosyltransferase involved in cell wall biosynthesis